MLNKFYVIVVVYLLVPAIAGCTLADSSEAVIDEETVSALIIGSAEHPDPVLEMVKELEMKGILKDVIVRESFPVQIQVIGPRSVIKQLQAIPRKESPGFK